MKRIVFLVLVVITLYSTASFADRVVKKNLGDLNGDGRIETAFIETYQGAGSITQEITIKQGNKILLSGLHSGGETPDGWKVVGSRIVEWKADWWSDSCGETTNMTKWMPMYYIFSWYGWNKDKNKYVLEKQGYTKKKLSYDDAAKELPQLALSRRNMIFASPSFELRARNLVKAKFTMARSIDLDNHFISQPYGRYINAVVVDKSGRYVAAGVTFCWNGQTKL